MNASPALPSTSETTPACSAPEMSAWWRTLLKLAWHDLHARYAAATLGFFWSIIQPLVMALILWLVIGVGLRAGNIAGVPFIAWLLPGMAAWSFFAEALNGATAVLQEYAFLVKKMRFPVIMLPPMKIISALAMHFVFLGLTLIILGVNGIAPSARWLLLPYYAIAMLALLVGLAWITAALNALARDIGHMVNVLLQFGFWLTPVFWNPELLAGHQLAWVLYLNPMYYIVDGYRQCLVVHDGPGLFTPAAAWFWGSTVICLAAGMAIFRRLRPHFADTL